MFHWCCVTDHGTAESKSRIVATMEAPSRRGIWTGIPRNPSSESGGTSQVHTGRVKPE